MTYTDWCILHGCQHGHCENACEKPQPTHTEWVQHPTSGIRCLVEDLICQRCLVVHGVVSVMIPCTPEVCA